tara:strand:+ start:701 stop:1171 length:471 start_codon:yes stop_codon:yes gene_type:complete
MGFKAGYDFAEEAMWIASIASHVEKAISPFKMPNTNPSSKKPALEVQYERIRKKYIKRGVKLEKRTDVYKTVPNILKPDQMKESAMSGHKTKMNDVRASRDWFVTPYFVGSEYGESQFASLAIDILGWSDIRVNDTHAFIQRAITLEKKLFEGFGV